MQTLAHIVASVIDHDAGDKLKTDFIGVFEDTDLSYEVIFELLENERLAPLVGDVAKIGFNKIGDGIGANFDGIAFDSSNIKDHETEAHELADVLSHVAQIMDKINSQGLDAFALAKDFGPLLDELDHTELVGHEDTSIVLKGIFLSHNLYSQIGMSRDEAGDIADSINEKSVVKGYAPLITALMDTVDVFQMTSANNSSNSVLVEKIEVLLQDLTPESAELLSEMTSENVMISKGVAQRSAKPMSNMFSDAFTGLSDAKENGMPEEQYNKEAKAMADMMNVSMNFNKSSSNGVFGEGSATGVEANEFVDNIFDSTVIAGTIVDTVYGEGEEPETDPLKFESKMGENDREKAVSALNDKWSSATDEQRADTEYQKTYVAIGALMNMNINITADGIIGE